MEEQKTIDNQATPTVEEISKKEVKLEKEKNESSDENISLRLVDALKALDAEGIRQVSAYINSKIDILNKLK